jgi:hypothetical protein
MRDLFDGPVDVARFLGKVTTAVLFSLAYVLTCVTLAGWTQ